MPKRDASPTPEPTTSGGPPPLRRRAEPPTRTKRRATWREVKAAFRHMSIARFRRDLGQWLVYGLVAFVVIFAAGAFFSFGDGGFGQDDLAEGEDFPVVARIGQDELPREQLDQMANRFSYMGMDSITQRTDNLGRLFDQWVDEQLLIREAQRRKIEVSKADVTAKIEEMVQERIDNERGEMTERNWRYKLQRQGITADEQIDQYRQEFEKSRDDIGQGLLLDRVREAIQDEVQVTDDDLKRKYDEVTAKAILVRVDPRKPFPPVEGQTESEDEAARRLADEQKYDEAMAKLKPEADKLRAEAAAADADFAELAKERSDDYTKDNGGDLGSFTRDTARWDDAFKDAVFALAAGAVSEPIKTDDGWVIAKVESRKAWPDDFKTADPRDFAAAKKLGEEVYAKLTDAEAPADFAELARELSEDEGSRENGGEYEMTGRGMWVKPFEKMAFALETDEISKPFRTQFGYHVMQVLERELPAEGEELPADEPDADEPAEGDEAAEKEPEDLPLPDHPDLPKAKQVRIRHILFKAEDPEKKVEDLRDKLQDELRADRLNELREELRKAAYAEGLVEVLDPQLKAYLAKKDGNREEELFWLQRAAAAWPYDHPEVHFDLGQRLEELGRFPATSTRQVAAAKAMAKFTAQEVGAGLTEGLNSFYPDVRVAVIEALAKVGHKSALPRLQEMYQFESDQTVVDALKSAIEQLGGELPERMSLPDSSLPAPGEVDGSVTVEPVAAAAETPAEAAEEATPAEAAAETE